MIRPSATTCLLLACMLLHLPSPAHAANIFDDDWTPPKPSKPTEPTTTATPKPASVPEPQTPPATSVPKPIPAAPVVRRQLPTVDAQAVSRKLFREVFATELADRSVPARRAFPRNF